MATTVMKTIFEFTLLLQQITARFSIVLNTYFCQQVMDKTQLYAGNISTNLLIRM